MVSNSTSFVMILLAIVSPNLIESLFFKTDPVKGIDDFSVLNVKVMGEDTLLDTQPVLVQLGDEDDEKIGEQTLVFKNVKLFDCHYWGKAPCVHLLTFGSPEGLLTHTMTTLEIGGKVKLRSHDWVKFGSPTVFEYTYKGKNPKNGKLRFERVRRDVMHTPQKKEYSIDQFHDKVIKGEVHLKDPSKGEYVPVNSHLFGLGTPQKQKKYNERVKKCRKDIIDLDDPTCYFGAHLDDYSDGLYQHDDYHYDEYGDYDDDEEYANYGGYEGYDDFREEMYDGDWQEGYTAGYHAAMQRLYRVIH